MKIQFNKYPENKPPYKTPLLLKYTRKGKPGECITEGYFLDKAKSLATDRHSEEFWRSHNYGDVFFDYADRQIQSLTAKGSKNIIQGWVLKNDVI